MTMTPIIRPAGTLTFEPAKPNEGVVYGRLYQEVGADPTRDSPSVMVAPTDSEYQLPGDLPSIEGDDIRYALSWFDAAGNAGGSLIAVGNPDTTPPSDSENLQYNSPN